MYALGVISVIIGFLTSVSSLFIDTNRYTTLGEVGNMPAQHGQLVALIFGGIFLLTGVGLIVGASIIDAIKETGGR